MKTRQNRLAYTIALLALCAMQPADAAEPNHADVTILQPQQPTPPRPTPRELQPAPDDPQHFVARARHFLEFARRNASSADDPKLVIHGGVEYPITAITPRAFALLEAEAAPFDPTLRDRALRCGRPANIPGARVLLVEVPEAAGLKVPVFITPDSNALRYLELSIDLPGAPILLIVIGYDGLAVRVTTSERTAVGAAHVHTYYPSIVLGVDPSRVTRQYLGGGDCVYGFSNAVHAAGVVSKLGVPADQVLRFTTRRGDSSRLVIGPEQATRRAPPRLGSFLDPEMPAPKSYGIVALHHLGYIRPARLEGRDLESRFQEVLKPFRLPEGLGGAHGVMFIVPPGGPRPSGDLVHSTIVEGPVR